MASPEGEDLIAEVRDLTADGEMFVGGDTAGLIDTRSAIADRLPLALGLIALATTVLLFLLSGSLLVPLKAMILNLLSLTATFGAMVWIFQDGNLSGVLGFTATGTIDTSTPILMFCIAFGLSMDYEVFLLSRIKEEHDRTGDNDEAVAVGLGDAPGRIVTAAAATAVGHVPRVRHVGRELHQDVRHRPRHRRPDGCVRDPRARWCRRS
ncbi:MAG: MMPL family transporter [Ilumatobacteraceae bacterium]